VQFPRLGEFEIEGHIEHLLYLLRGEVEVLHGTGEPMEHMQPLDEVEMAGHDHILTTCLVEIVVWVRGSVGSELIPMLERIEGHLAHIVELMRSQPHPQSSMAASPKNQPAFALSISQQSHTSSGTSRTAYWKKGNLEGLLNSTASATISRLLDLLLYRAI